MPHFFEYFDKSAVKKVGVWICFFKRSQYKLLIVVEYMRICGTGFPAFVHRLPTFVQCQQPAYPAINIMRLRAKGENNIFQETSKPAKTGCHVICTAPDFLHFDKHQHYKNYPML